MGGALGSLIRYGVVLALPDTGPIPWDVVLVNTVGAFLLGVLVGWLAQVPGTRARRQRLLWGTGALGGFTTYGALALSTVDIARDERLAAAMLVSVGSVCVGLLACGVGVALGSRAAVAGTRA